MFEELVERLEKATGPDRELDRDILRYVSGRVVRDETFIYGPKHGKREIETVYPFRLACWFAPRFTASIATALSASEPGWEYSISTLYGIAEVEIPLNDSHVTPVRVRREHGNVPVALCEAIMKARAAERLS